MRYPVALDAGPHQTSASPELPEGRVWASVTGPGRSPRDAVVGTRAWDAVVDGPVVVSPVVVEVVGTVVVVVSCSRLVSGPATGSASSSPAHTTMRAPAASRAAADPTRTFCFVVNRPILMASRCAVRP